MSVRQLPVFALLIAACSLLGMAIVFIITTQGVSTWVDSAHYITAARHLVAGETMELCYGTPYLRFPPLFPATIASTMALGLAPLEGIRLINVVAFGVLILAAGWLYRLSLRSGILAVLGALAVALSWQQVLWAIHALTETVFTMLILLFLLQMWFFLKKQTPARFVLLVLAAALVTLQRYTGITVLAAGGLCLLLFLRQPFMQRLKYGVAFGICAALPLGVWLARNYAISGTILGVHGERQTWGLEYLSYIASPMLDWFVPQRIGRGGTVTGTAAGDLLGILLLIALSLWLYHRSRGTSPLEAAEFQPGWLAVVFFAVYFVVIQVGAPSVEILGAASRLTAPMYPLMILLVLWGLDRFGLWLNGRSQEPVGQVIVVALVAAWLVLPAEKIWREASGLSRSDGWTGFSSSEMRTSPLVNWETPEMIVEPLFSNKVLPLCILNSVHAMPISATDADMAEARLLAAESDVLTLIIFPDNERYDMQYSIEAFADNFTMEPLLTLEGETGIYRLTRSDSQPS